MTVQYTKFVCQKNTHTQLYLDNRMYVHYRATCSELGYVLAQVSSKKHTEDDKVAGRKRLL
jgi:hypothetical protein